MDYIEALGALGEKIKAVTGVSFHTVSYSGGVPGGTSIDKLPFEKHGEYKAALTELFGEPEEVTPWFYQHTKGVPPLKWKLAAKMEINKLDHVQLISMMQHKKKRYLIISYM